MKNQSLPTVVWWKTRNRKNGAVAKHFLEGFGMQELVTACHMGIISSFEQTKIRTLLEKTFSRPTDRWFIAPICSPCHRRFAELNHKDIEHAADFDVL